VKEMLTFLKKIRTESESERVQAVRSVNVNVDEVFHPKLEDLGYSSKNELKLAIYDLIARIKDPEKPESLEELNVVSEDMIFVQDIKEGQAPQIRIEFKPTVSKQRQLLLNN
jgi:hypothetical protein